MAEVSLAQMPPDIGPGNGLVPPGDKPLPESILIQCCITITVRRNYATLSEVFHVIRYIIVKLGRLS